MSRRRQDFGKHGEDLACGELERRGYAILARRYRQRGGEIDIIARDGEAMVFVEVKTRETGEFGDGTDAVTDWKRRRMKHVATDFLMRHQLVDRVPCRFDVVSIKFGGGAPAIEVFQNAFDA